MSYYYTEKLCNSLLQNCKTLKQIKQIQSIICKSGFETDPLISGKFILNCAISVPNSVSYAFKFLSYLQFPDSFMYNAVIRGFSESDTPKDAIFTFIEMRRKSIFPDSFSFAFASKSAANLRDLRVGFQVHCQSLVFGFNTHLFVGTTLTSMYGECGVIEYARKVFDEMSVRNVVAWNALLTACFRCGDLRYGEEVFDQMPVLDSTSWNVMLVKYVKAGEIKFAKELFEKIPVKDDVSWSTMIHGFVQSGNFEEAFTFFREMRKLCFVPNEASLTSVLSACAQTGAFESSRILHGFLEKGGFCGIVSVSNALLDAYAKCGNIGMAKLVFSALREKTCVVSWTSMIAGLAMHGYGEEAINLFGELEKCGILPDEATFVSVLYSCSHAGLVQQGCEYFHKMKDVYGLEPSIEHYGCMVDLYGRAGLLQKAYDFILQLHLNDCTTLWRILLGACSIHGNIEMAEEVKSRISEFEPRDFGDHVLLSNIYATKGKWKDAAAMRRSMSSLGIKKKPGWSIIEVGKTMYTFVAGGERDEISELAYQKLKEIMLRIKVEGGYVPQTDNVLYDVGEEEKEYALSRHSEKLAVAFGMLRLSEGSVIRVVKNLRICSDCHTVMKLVSKIYSLEIVIRDRSRFHTFNGGVCTCRDYW
ncbi:pentatricopeptide repeat-containing protein At1g74630 [Silene latifolia]|uniref:pentatricopeptide repeat-containing protein At1g74630 n=1 Tax=Silene latifolia TaxID=37657 RepID=UPI003D775C77